jgi:hypothetical protein
MGENTTLAQIPSNCCGHFPVIQTSDSLHPNISSSCLSPSSPFCQLFFLVYYFSFLHEQLSSSHKTHVLYSALWYFSAMLFLHVQQPLCTYSVISFLRIHMQLLYSCNNWKVGKGKWKDGVDMVWHEKLLFEANKQTF